ncbi:hypothetical protein [Flavobacterium sp. WG21]|uniref:hypothetical protein n=1 Tax=Flavobacterium sp. WG21 TaxID=1229487 RepID=UPI00034C8226|nr:hypothetical protein [Flavobacterium sp. WG21]
MYINEALNFNILRFSGKKETLENKRWKLSNFQDGNCVYSLGLFFKKLDFEEILYLLKNETLSKKIELNNFDPSVFEDVFSIMEVLLRIFKFRDSSYINDRLKNFCFIQILLNNLKKSTVEKNDLHFEKILFF